MALYRYENDTFEIFYANDSECEEWNLAENLSEDTGDSIYTKGYYFAFCQPGCMVDSAPFGPYESEDIAYDAAVEMIEE